ncbi:putative nuclease HARBI1 [Dermacentor silvarum]|uniref:putative nuclease HARBI1 n=1 Tax=Dermacentor silvarum TaxID=543639 RepID=UPI0021007A0B|nr:putative nuclease HARBI1 [Dermacentor silvarum]
MAHAHSRFVTECARAVRVCARFFSLCALFDCIYGMTLTRPHSQNIALILLVRRLRKKRKRTMYIRELFDKRPQLGDYHQLVQELRQVDPEYHFKYFRMTKAKFDHLLSLVYERILHAPNHRRPIRPAERLAVTLRFLATGASMQDIAMSYCMHATAVAGILKETLPAIWDCLSPLVLKPPAAADWVKIRRAYSSKWNFPNVVGSIDGKHFAIQCPDNSGSDYFNYKGFYSIVLLAVADADYRFTLVEVGAQGRTSDGAFFNDSSIREVFEHGSLELPTAVNGWPVFMAGQMLAQAASSIVPSWLGFLEGMMP